jgi:hypothetical protein
LAEPLPAPGGKTKATREERDLAIMAFLAKEKKKEGGEEMRCYFCVVRTKGSCYPPPPSAGSGQPREYLNDLFIY